MNVQKTLKISIIATMCNLAIPQTWACGDGLFWTLLDGRDQALKAFPERYFRDDIRDLSKARKELPRINKSTTDEYQPKWFVKDLDANDPLYEIKRLNNIEKRYFGEKVAEKIFALRQLDYLTLLNSDVSGLSPSIPTYLYGAAAFREKDFTTAVDHFNHLIEQNDLTNPIYPLWARYSVARSYVAMQQDDMALRNFDAVREFYQQHSKTPDDLNLVLTSLGEQARIYLRQNNYHKAIELYALQNAQGDSYGEASLVIVAKKLINMPLQDLKTQLQSPLVQRLVMMWLIATTDQSSVYYVYESPASNQEKELLRVKAIVNYLVQEAKIAPDQQEVFAQMLYRQGFYAQAEQLVPKLKDSGMKWWLSAKLALRHGDIGQARQAYAKAAAYFPQQQPIQPDEYWSAIPNEFCRINAESAILSLKQDDFVEAIQQLWYGKDFYWDDIGHVAERVLTTPQLIAFVEKNAKAPDEKALTDRNHDGKVDEEDDYYPLPIEQQLRNLLARRLMREKQYDQALTYFDPQIRQYAKQFMSAQRAAQSGWKMDVQRASHYFAAARVMREHGMQIVGYAGSPDNSSADGAFPATSDNDMIQSNKLWLSAKELHQMQLTQATPDIRYHYRTLAANLAQQAAQRVPERSQAYAASLCFASRWTMSSDPKTAVSSYRQYLKYGAYVPWGNRFGAQCPEPEFSQLWYKQWYYPWLEIKQQLRPFKVAIYWGMFIFILLMGGLIYKLRQRQ